MEAVRKTTVSKLFVALCALLLGVVCLVGISAEEAFADSSVEVYVGGVGMSDGDYLAEGTSAVTTTKPADNYAYYTNGVLTLHNYSYDGPGYNYDMDWCAGIYSASDLGVRLEGENSLRVPSSGNDTEGITLGEGADLDVSGEGSLEIIDSLCGIYLFSGEVNFFSGTLDITSTNVCIYVTGDTANTGRFTVSGGCLILESANISGISADGPICVYDGAVTVEAKLEGIISMSDIEIYGGELSVVADRDALYASGSVVVEGGTISAKSCNVEEDSYSWAISFGDSFDLSSFMAISAATEADGTLGTYLATEHTSYDYIQIVPTTTLFDVFVGGVGMNSGDYLAEGASVVTTTKPADNYAHYADGVLTLHNYSYTGAGFEYYEGWNAAVYSEHDLEIVLEGANALETKVDHGAEGVSLYRGASLTVSGNGSLDIVPVDTSDSMGTYGVYISEGSFTFEDGNLTIDAGCGVYADTGIEVNDGNIASIADYDGLSTYRDLVIDGGSVVTSARHDAVYANGDVIVDGGELSAASFDTEDDGDWWAIYFGGAFTVSDGMTVKASTEPDGELVDYVAADHESYDWILIKQAAPSIAFVDVPEDSWFYKPVAWAVSKRITSGTSATTFSPDATCTRAQAVTFLWNAAGKPAPSGTAMPFADVADGAWYRDAVLWAVEQGITSGTSATTFSPDATCTRAQIVTFLWNSESKPTPGSSACPFVDVPASAWYRTSVLWAVENGVTSGTSATTFSPDANCTRAQIVTFMHNYMAD